MEVAVRSTTSGYGASHGRRCLLPPLTELLLWVMLAWAQVGECGGGLVRSASAHSNLTLNSTTPVGNGGSVTGTPFLNWTLPTNSMFTQASYTIGPATTINRTLPCATTICPGHEYLLPWSYRLHCTIIGDAARCLPAIQTTTAPSMSSSCKEK
jgi:hypothetical protein